jgi:hypothetical protein
MLPEDLGQNQNFLRTSPGRLDRPLQTELEKGEPRVNPQLCITRSPDSPNGLQRNFGDPGSPHGRPLPQRNCTETLSIMGNPKSHDETSRTRAPTKTTKSESFPRVWTGKVTKKRGTRSSCVTPTPNPAKKCLQNSATKIPRKGSENHQKEKRERQQKP